MSNINGHDVLTPAGSAEQVELVGGPLCGAVVGWPHDAPAQMPVIYGESGHAALYRREQNGKALHVH